jgi:RNA polymerase sigma factor (sigma-70 family)
VAAKSGHPAHGLKSLIDPTGRNFRINRWHLEDPAADYARVMQPLEGRMIQSVWRILRDADDADDALQSALATLWRKWDKLRRHANPEALVQRVCINAAYDQLRKRSRRKRREQAGAGAEADSTAEPSRQIEQQETEREIMTAIAGLPGKQRVATYLRLVEGRGYKEIANILSCGQPTARKHVERGRAKLQAVLPHLTNMAPQRASERQQ